MTRQGMLLNWVLSNRTVLGLSIVVRFPHNRQSKEISYYFHPSLTIYTRDVLSKGCINCPPLVLLKVRHFLTVVH